MRVINVVRPFKITLADHSQVSFGIGPHQVSDEVADSTWTRNFISDGEPEVGTREYAVAATEARDRAKAVVETAQAALDAAQAHAAEAWATFEKARKDAILRERAAAKGKGKVVGSAVGPSTPTTPHAQDGPPDELVVNRRRVRAA